MDIYELMDGWMDGWMDNLDLPRRPTELVRSNPSIPTTASRPRLKTTKRPGKGTFRY